MSGLDGSRGLAGGVDDCGKKSAMVARTFIRLYQGWLENFFGKPFQRDPSTARVSLHVYNGECTKEGPSLGPAFAGELIGLGRTQAARAG